MNVVEIHNSFSNLHIDHPSTSLSAPNEIKTDKYRCPEPGPHISFEIPPLVEAQLWNKKPREEVTQ